MGRRRRKRKNWSTDSESDCDPNQTKQLKKRGPSEGTPERQNISVSEVLKATNSVLFNEDNLDLNLDQGTNSDSEDNCVFIVSDTQSERSRGNKGDHPINTKMAPPESPSRTIHSDRQDRSTSDKLDTLINAVTEIKSNQDSMRRMFESKLDKMKSDLIANIDCKVRALRDELSMDIGLETNRIDQVLTTIQSIQSRVDTLEQTDSGTDQRSATNNATARGQPLDDPYITCVASNVPVSDSEDLMQKLSTIIEAFGEDISSRIRITAVTRIPSKIERKPGLVKFSLENTEQKTLVLKNKWKLKDSDDYKQVFIQSSKSRVERLIEMNARELLRNIPQGRALRVDASGRIKQRDQSRQGQPAAATTTAGTASATATEPGH